VIETPQIARSTLLSRLDQFVIMEDVSLADVTESLGCLTVCGPSAAASVTACTGVSGADLAALPEYGQITLGLPRAFVAASHAFGVPGFDLFAPAGDLGIWRVLLAARVLEASAVLVETARIEAGRPRFGLDMREDTIPLEAGIEPRAISFTKGCYVGQEVVIRILHRGQGRVARRLVWVSATGVDAGSPVWQPGAEVHAGNKAVGSITSACWSPARAGLLGIAMLHRDAAEPGSTVRVGSHDATVQRLP
ncbi:MAG: YgfZ/GcvT domain-containing protein, partial [Luteitalea sp.]